MRYEQIANKIIVEAFCCNGSCLGRHENRRALGVVASYPNFDEEPFFIPLFGGGKGIRTPGLLIANETLYQLSYTPRH